MSMNLRRFSTAQPTRSLTKRDAAKQKANEEYKNWSQAMRNKLANTEGPMFLGGNRKPFPYNKDYTAPSMLSQSTAHEIENCLREGQTARSISQKYSVSIDRVKALNAMSRLKESMKENVPVEYLFPRDNPCILTLGTEL